MKKEVFISYSSKDTEIAHEIFKAIEDCDITVWIAPDCIPIGANYGGAIDLAIEECSIMVVVYSNACNASEHVANEIDTAFNERKLIIPFCIDDSPMSRNLRYYLRRKQHLNAFPNYKVHIQKLLDTLCSALGRPNLSTIKKQKDEPTSTLPSNDLVRNTFNPQKDKLKQIGKSSWKTLVDVYNSSDKEEGEHPISLPHDKTSECGDIPKSLSFNFNGRKFYMILSEDESYYIGNFNAKADDLNWLDNKWVNTMGSVALCAGAAVASFNPPLNFPYRLTGLSWSTYIHVHSELCNNLNKLTGYLYLFQLPCKNELKGVKDYAIPSCIILRLKDNPDLLTIIGTKGSNS